MPLDRIAEIVYWPVLELDPLRLSLWMQVWHIVWKIGMKLALDARSAANLPASATGNASSKNLPASSRPEPTALRLVHSLARGNLGRTAGVG